MKTYGYEMIQASFFTADVANIDCHWFHGLRQTHLQGDFAKHLAIDLREVLLWPL